MKSNRQKVLPVTSHFFQSSGLKSSQSFAPVASSFWHPCCIINSTLYGLLVLLPTKALVFVTLNGLLGFCSQQKPNVYHSQWASWVLLPTKALVSVRVVQNNLFLEKSCSPGGSGCHLGPIGHLIFFKFFEIFSRVSRGLWKLATGTQNSENIEVSQLAW